MEKYFKNGIVVLSLFDGMSMLSNKITIFVENKIYGVNL